MDIVGGLFVNLLWSVILSNLQSNLPKFGIAVDWLKFKASLETDPIFHFKKSVKYPAQLITSGYNIPVYLAIYLPNLLQFLNDK